jgi:hypothetical protein
MNPKSSLLTVAIICGLTVAVAVKAQSPVVIRGGKLCEKYLLNKVAKDKAAGSLVVTLQSFDRNDQSLGSDVKKWLVIANEETLATHELRYRDKRALLLNANHIHATGLAINFQYWFIKVGDHSTEFLSQSKNPNLIFWDRDGLLNYYCIDFSDDFVQKKDWGNVTLNLLRYRVSPDSESQLISKESNVKCE